MNEEIKIHNESQNIDELRKVIQDDLLKIKKDYENKLVDFLNIFNLNNHLCELKLTKSKDIDIYELFTLDYLFFFRIVLIYEKSTRIEILQILKNCIKISPTFTNKIIDAMIPIILCKIFENEKNSSFEERYECLKIFLTWLELSDSNFPIIFPQAVACKCKTDDPFKIGCLEFLRIMSIIRPDLCSTVGGFKILIHSLIEENISQDLFNKIIHTLIYLVNSPNKRKYFNGLRDFDIIFSVFTKSDFSSGPTTNIETPTEQKKIEIKEKTRQLERRLDSAINIIKKLLITWPGFFLLMKDKMSINSLPKVLNNDVNDVIKKAILTLFKDILMRGYNILDNFNMILSEDKDYLYINKIYLAHIVQGLYNNNLNENLYKFIENTENNELREFAVKLTVKFNILYTKLSNYDFHSPFGKENMEQKKWVDDIKYNNDFTENNKENINYKKIIESHFFMEDEKQKANNKIKVMHLLDKIFHHLNCKDTPLLTIDSLSIEIIIAVHAMLNLDYIKNYESHYSINSCKNILYSNDDDIFPQILKNTKVIELKDFQSWDWNQIDFLLDIVSVKKKLIPELVKQKFFKKLLFSYYPSKNLIVKQAWIVENFFYGAIGNKLFKLLVEQDDLSILDSSYEDNIFSKSNTWIKDLMQCMDILFNENLSEDHPFTKKSIYNTLSRNVFIFIGIISNSKKGDYYLYKQGFYSLLDKLLNTGDKFDYLITIIIDNLNFSSKYANNWIQRLIENGNDQIKKYILNHIHCLLILGKDIITDVKVLFKIIDPNYPERNKIITFIIKILINKSIIDSSIFKDEYIIDKIKQNDKSLLYILMRDTKIYDYLIDIINKEADNTNIDEIVKNYAKVMTKSMLETFTDKNETKYFLTISLSNINNKYHHYYEYFWIKQLPINIVIQTLENKEKKNEFILNNYLEYNEDHNLLIVSQPQESQKIIIDSTFSTIQLKCFLGTIAMSKNGNSKNNISNCISFSVKDIVNEKISNKQNNLFIIKKDCVNFVFKKNDNNNNNSYTLEKIFFVIRIIPDIITSFKTPINLITELTNNKKGIEKLIEIKAIEKILSYSEKKDYCEIDKNANLIRSSFWILTKLMLNNEMAQIIQNKFKVLEKMVFFFFSFKDCSMRGTIIYLTSLISRNSKLMPEIKNIQVKYFFNTNIGYPTTKQVLFIDKSIFYENNKLNNDMIIIENRIKLSPISQEIYNCFTGLANNITFNQSLRKLDEIYRKNIQFFKDEKLFVLVYAVLTKFNLKETARKAILYYFEKCIFSSELALKGSLLLKNLGDNILNANNL